MDRNGNLFFVAMDPVALICWDSSLPYKLENLKIVVQNDVTLQFASGLKIIKNLDGNDEIWILTNRFQVLSIIMSSIVTLFIFASFFLAENNDGNYGSEWSQL